MEVLENPSDREVFNFRTNLKKNFSIHFNLSHGAMFLIIEKPERLRQSKIIVQYFVCRSVVSLFMNS